MMKWLKLIRFFIKAPSWVRRPLLGLLIVVLLLSIVLLPVVGILAVVILLVLGLVAVIVSPIRGLMHHIK